MVENPTPPIADGTDLEKLRRDFLKAARFGHHEILGQLQQSKDKEYPFTISRGGKSAPIRFRRWKYGEAIVFTQLPFYDKILASETLTPDEMDRFALARVELVREACLDKNRWDELVELDPRVVDQAFITLTFMSGLNDSFAAKLVDFMDSDLGYNYGLIWFTILKRTPSEIADLPFADVMAVNVWAQKWGERMNKARPNG